MNLLKSHAKTTLKCELKINITEIKKFQINQIQKLSRMDLTENQTTFRIPDLYKEANSGILASTRMEHLPNFEVFEFMMPGDALMQKPQ